MRRPWLTVAMLVALGILIGLGAWQLARGEAKAALLADLAARAEAEAVDLAPVIAQARAGADTRYTRIAAAGTYGPSAVYLVATRGGRAGWREFRLFTPDGANGGAPVIVDRGFHPAQTLDPASARTPGGLSAQIEALVAPAPKPGLFTPPADAAAGVFYVRNVADMAAALGGDPGAVAPFTVAVITEAAMTEAAITETTRAPQAAASAPIPTPPRLEDISNRHLEYALTWFGLGAALLGVYGAMILAERRSRPAASA